MVSGIRILLNLNQCRGPLTIQQGVIEALQGASEIIGLTVLKFSVEPFPDGTVNFHYDLAESHCSGGTYLADRHAALEICMCHETSDNTDLARRVGLFLFNQFKPMDYNVDTDWIEIPWKSR